LLVVLLGSAPQAAEGQASAAESQTAVAEGRILNQPSGTLYYYRIDADSTVLIRQERPPAEAPGVTLPASTILSVYHRVQDQLLSPSTSDEILGIGYEDQALVLRFTQRFNLYVLVTLIVVLVVGGGLLAWLWGRLAAERRRRKAIAQSRRYLAEGREKERERLAQEIHDGPVQDLHGLHMQLKTLPDADLDAMGDELMRVTGELRAMSANLHPPALERFGLPAALRSHADRLTNRHDDLEIDMDLAEECESLPDEYALSVFRVAQEAMNNAVQHGDAGRIRVRLRCDAPEVRLCVQDDGTGFALPDDWRALGEEDHYGLLGMQERAEALHADLDIETAPGEGTRVRLRGSLDDRPASNTADAPPPAVSASSF
jgi:signal transduction histidine kinase